jgi:hypothetical protein
MRIRLHAERFPPCSLWYSTVSRRSVRDGFSSRIRGEYQLETHGTCIARQFAAVNRALTLRVGANRKAKRRLHISWFATFPFSLEVQTGFSSPVTPPIDQECLMNALPRK